MEAKYLKRLDEKFAKNLMELAAMRANNELSNVSTDAIAKIMIKEYNQAKTKIKAICTTFPS